MSEKVHLNVSYQVRNRMSERRDCFRQVSTVRLCSCAVTSNYTHGAGTRTGEPGDWKNSRGPGSDSQWQGGWARGERHCWVHAAGGPNQKSADVLRLRKAVFSNAPDLSESSLEVLQYRLTHSPYLRSFHISQINDCMTLKQRLEICNI